MQFDFLPKLPNSELDDRKYKDLVQECLLRIPRYCPEWTNYNPSDPGITLVELFAWLTDQMQLRFNQVPRRNYVAFLELLGIRLNPPQPAHTDLTFYLVAPLEEAVWIFQDTEVATERTATEEAIVFSTDRELIIGTPRIRNFLTSTSAEDRPHRDRLTNRFADLPAPQTVDWSRIEQTQLFTPAQSGSCFYLVLDTANPQNRDIQGNVVAITFAGEPATGTGIDPNNPPLRWEVWANKSWQTIERVDDQTKGFNFVEDGSQGANRVRRAKVTLHLPPNLEETDFGTDGYTGYWIRCTYDLERFSGNGYSTPPRILGLGIHSIGGTIPASQCMRVREELLGVSDGKAGQMFQLQMSPVLNRHPNTEYIEVRSFEAPPEVWTEVRDFGTSSPTDRHYTLDSLTGEVRFGPLVQGPRRLRQRINERAKLQENFQRPIVGALWRENNREQDSRFAGLPDVLGADRAFVERQHGAVPPTGAEIYMVSYRFGGGRQGNVKADRLTILKSAVPFVSRVANHEAASGGTNEDSLEEAVIRVPELLRTRECAVTPEDFERVVKQVSQTAQIPKIKPVRRAYCLTDAKHTTGGIVRLLIVPEIDEPIEWLKGISPQDLKLDEPFQKALHEAMQNRRPLGIDVKFQEPEYVGACVVIDGLLVDREYRSSDRARGDIRNQILLKLYQFLNPLTGGVEGQGWEWGRSLSIADIIAQCQQIKGVLYLGAVQLYEIRKQENGFDPITGEDRYAWSLFEARDGVIDPGPFGTITSWAGDSIDFSANGRSESGHTIHLAD